MRLLVSVQAPVEVQPALAGGADILDAKDPSRGSLGAVAPDALARILALVPHDFPFSIAVGDLTAPDQVESAVGSVKLLRRVSPTFLKLGFAGVQSPNTVREILQCAVATTQGYAGVVGVAYADWERAFAPEPELVLDLAHQCGASGVLLDTHTKDGRGLLQWRAPALLSSWVAKGRGLGLLTALAGEIRLSDLDAVGKSGPDIVGVRGAACRGGREGRVTVGRVRALRRKLGQVTPPWGVHRGTLGVRETREGGANSVALTAPNSLKINA